MAASLTIGTIAAIVGTAGSVAGGAYAGVQQNAASEEAKKAKNAEETQLYNQQKAASDANQQTNAKQAATMALVRQRSLQAAGGGNWGGTLGTGGSGAPGGGYNGGLKVALGQ